MPRVKICGTTSLEDALVAVEAGADYLGFVLWPHSKRAVHPSIVREIALQLQRLPRRPLLVGVFVNETAANIAYLLDTCHLDLAQLHGEESPRLLTEPDSPIYGRSYKALRPTSLTQAEAEAKRYLPPQSGDWRPSLLIDSYHPTLYGGTGQTTNWEIAAQLSASVPGLMLAGGLTTSNVARAILQVRPFAVDVASGVESSPGRKNHALVQAFIATVKSV